MRFANAKNAVAPNLQRALSLMLQAAAARLGMSVESCLLSQGARLAVCDAFSLMWLAIEDASALAGSMPPTLRLAEGLTSSMLANLRELNATGALELSPEDWLVPSSEDSENTEASLQAELLSSVSLLDRGLTLWLCEPKQLRRVIETLALALEITFDAARIPTRARPLTLAELTVADRAALLDVFGTYATHLPSHKAPKPTTSTAHYSDIAQELDDPETQGDAVQFTVYRPNAISPTERSSLIAFAHLASKRPDAPEDEPEPAERAKQQAAAILGPRLDAYRPLAGDATCAIPKESQLTFVPSIAGVEVFPREQHVIWSEDLHRVEFQLRALPSMVGRRAIGTVTIYIGPLIVGSVSVSMQVAQVVADNDKQRFAPARTVRSYDRIFASYSRADSSVVEAVRDIVGSLGHRYIIDVTELRSGEVWSKRLEALITEAQVFQLFWSQRSMRSPFVRKEWEYALALNREGFVRPTFWEDPRPSAPEEGLPPPELDRLNFQRLPMPAAARVVSGLHREAKRSEAQASISELPKITKPEPGKLRGLWPAATALAALLGIASVMLTNHSDQPAVFHSFPDVDEQVQLAPDPDIRPVPDNAQPLHVFTLRIETHPAGAFVYDVDKDPDVLVGQTPLEITKPLQGKRDFIIRAPNYRDETLSVSPDTKPVVEITLSPQRREPRAPKPAVKEKKSKARPQNAQH